MSNNNDDPKISKEDLANQSEYIKNTDKINEAQKLFEKLNFINVINRK